MSNQSSGDVLQNEVLTVQEIAVYLRVSRVTVWRWCKRGIIPAFRIGRHWHVRRIDLLNEMENLPLADLAAAYPNSTPIDEGNSQSLSERVPETDDLDTDNPINRFNSNVDNV